VNIFWGDEAHRSRLTAQRLVAPLLLIKSLQWLPGGGKLLPNSLYVNRQGLPD
jgi:hypothetical protein